MLNYYILGCHRGSSAEDIKAAWKLLSRARHPDHQPEAEKAQATEEFAELSAAYAVLKDAKTRARYDGSLDIGSKPCSECAGSGFVSKRLGYSRSIKNACQSCFGTGRQKTSRK